MSAAKKIMPFPVTEVKKVADLEDGYTRIANELLEKILHSDFTLRQIKVLLAVARKTYGFNKKTDWIGNKQLSDLTGFKETRCSTIKNQLISMNVLVTKGREIGINKNMSEWCLDRPQQSKTVTKTDKETFTKTVNPFLPKQVNTKETITKQKRNMNTLSSGDDQNKKNSSIDYQAVADAYNEILGDRLPNVKKLSDKRKRAIKSLMTKYLAKNTIESAISYFNAFGSRAKPFYFGDNKTGWIANLDFVIRESTVIAVREGSISRAEFTE